MALWYIMMCSVVEFCGKFGGIKLYYSALNVEAAGR
jgi:hypothetical protein